MNRFEKLEELGTHARVLIDLHLEDPKRFDAKKVMDHLVDKYAALEFEPIKTYEETKEYTNNSE